MRDTGLRVGSGTGTRAGHGRWRSGGRPRTPRGALRRGLHAAIVAVVALGIAAAGCSGPDDSLEAIRARQDAGDFAGSLEPLRERLQREPGDAELQYRYGHALVATGQPSLAEWALREAMKDPEWLVPAGLQLAYAALASEDYAMAIETANQVLAEHPDNAEVLLLRANAYAHSRTQPEAALADADRLL